MAIQSSNEAIRGRIKLAVLCFVLLFAFLAWHLYGVQVVRHEELFEKAKRQYTTVKTSKTKRGEIFDASGNLLVGNTPCENITVDPTIVPAKQEQAMAAMLANHLKLDYREVLRKLNTKFREVKDEKTGQTTKRAIRYAVIARNVPHDVALKIREADKRLNLTGLFFEETYMREYPKSRLLSNVLGFTNMEHDKIIAVMGVEKFYNQEMQAVSGKIIYERALDGNVLPYGNSTEIAGRDGLNVYLTIHEPIQAILEEELDKVMQEWKPNAAYAVMADPRTGNIMAMAQRPSFDPNDRSSLKPEAYRIRIIEDTFEPGSVMKPLAISGALDCGLITPDTIFDCEKGRWVYLNRPLSDSSRLGLVPVREIVKKSSNIGTAKIGLMMGEDRLNATLHRFGLGERTGLPLKPESTGIFVDANPRRDKLAVTRYPIGYGVGVTPVQMGRAYCALANNGNLRELRLFDRAENPETGEVIHNPLLQPRVVFDNPNTWHQIVDMMVGVTAKDGTGRRAGIPGYRVAGKSGTSRKFVNGRYDSGKYYASFTGFVPADDAAFVLMVVVDEPHGSSYFGGTVSAPVFKAIAERTLRYLDIKPDPALLEETKK